MLVTFANAEGGLTWFDAPEKDEAFNKSFSQPHVGGLRRFEKFFKLGGSVSPHPDGLGLGRPSPFLGPLHRDDWNHLGERCTTVREEAHCCTPHACYHMVRHARLVLLFSLNIPALAPDNTHFSALRTRQPPNITRLHCGRSRVPGTASVTSHSTDEKPSVPRVQKLRLQHAATTSKSGNLFVPLPTNGSCVLLRGFDAKTAAAGVSLSTSQI